MLKAVLFDQDGVIIDTERDGHRAAFNLAFKEFGLDCEWDPEFYHTLLQIGGGKERIRRCFEQYYQGGKIRGAEDCGLDDLVKKLHGRKTAIFLDLVKTMPLRPGVLRFMREIQAAGLKIGVCTTSNEKAAQAIVHERLGEIRFDVLIAGDMVSKKKPDPEIYLSALAKLGIDGSECLVVEDSGIGTIAGSAAGCTVLATVNGYTRNEDLSAAAWVASCLGDPEGEKAEFIGAPLPLETPGVIAVKDFLKAGALGGRAYRIRP
jgi:HAD superfamily hydrolase (TIGR01509 family)